MGKRDITLAASLAPFAAMGLGAADEAAAQPDNGYDAVGISAGGFQFFPELELSVEYNDNVLAADDVVTPAQSDYLYQLLPSARLVSDWSSHELTIYGEAASRFYSDFSDQNSTDIEAGFDARIDVDRNFNFTGGASYADLTEPLSQSPATVQLAEPVEFMRSRADVGFAKAFNQLTISGKAGFDTFDYEDGVAVNDIDDPNDDVLFEQDFRDRTSTTYGVRADYNVSPATSLFVSATANKREYDLTPPDPGADLDRNSEGYDVLGGVKFEATNLIQGEIGVGYLSQEYDDPGSAAVDGLAVRAAINWQPDELVAVNVGVERAVRDSGTLGSTGYVANDFTFGVDYAFRRNIDLSLESRYSRDEYNDTDREDTRWTLEASADYALNRSAAIFVMAGHDQQESTATLITDVGRDFEVNRVAIGLRLRR